MMQTILAWKCGVAYQHQHCSARSVAAGTAKNNSPWGSKKGQVHCLWGN